VSLSDRGTCTSTALKLLVDTPAFRSGREIPRCLEDGVKLRRNPGFGKFQATIPRSRAFLVARNAGHVNLNLGAVDPGQDPLPSLWPHGSLERQRRTFSWFHFCDEGLGRGVSAAGAARKKRRKRLACAYIHGVTGYRIRRAILVVPGSRSSRLSNLNLFFVPHHLTTLARSVSLCLATASH
jgi:hypothetical protein